MKPMRRCGREERVIEVLRQRAITDMEFGRRRHLGVRARNCSLRSTLVRRLGWADVWGLHLRKLEPYVKLIRAWI